MGLRSNRDPEKNMFLNVDVHMYTTTVTFLFHEDMTQEAMTAIPALPVILEAKFGARIWDWFSEEAKEHAQGYYWDPKTGLKSEEDERMAEILGDWGAKWGSDDDDDRSTSTASTAGGRVEPFQIVTQKTGKNQYYDDGSSVGTFRTAVGKAKQNEFVADATSQESTASTQESPASTLTANENWETDFQQKMQGDPAFKAYILNKYLDDTSGGMSKPPDTTAAAPGSGDRE